jgi:hypothetical protein
MRNSRLNHWFKNFQLPAALLLAGTSSMAMAQVQPHVYAHQYDLVVYGATPSGISAAVEAARHDLHVAIIEPGAHIGGMMAGGLSRTDTGNKIVIGGIAREFFERVGARYGQPIEWNFEPHVASAVFDQMLRDAHVDIYMNKPILEQGGVQKQGQTILALATADNQLFRAKVFIDATYEGTLMGASGVSYTWGRESENKYGEGLAGYRVADQSGPSRDNFTTQVSPYAANGTLLPGVQSSPDEKLGDFDGKIQAYGFRLCITQRDDNKLPFPKPVNYQPADYALLARQLEALTVAHGHAPDLGELVSLGALPNDKFDVNDLGAISTDDLGSSWRYPAANAAQRATIWQAHYDYEAGFFYFLGHDPSVPVSLRNEVNSYGLAKDEFIANHGWPWQLYVRESRRMLGEYILTERDLENDPVIDRSKTDAIGLGSYAMDMHNVERIPLSNGLVQNEGGTYVPVKAYQIPYRSLLPMPSETDNLLVTVCLSASHVAYASLRMEPQYMIVGQAAGLAATFAVHGDTTVYQIPLAAMQAQLKTEHAVLDIPGTTAQ